MIKTMPFLLFDGKCAEAMSFYQNCFGGELNLVKVEDTPMKNNFEEKGYKKITYSLLRNETIEISATDWLHKTRLPRQGNTVAIYIESDTKNNIERIFEALSAGAS